LIFSAIEESLVAVMMRSVTPTSDKTFGTVLLATTAQKDQKYVENYVQNQSTHSLHLNSKTFIILKFELSLQSTFTKVSKQLL